MPLSIKSFIIYLWTDYQKATSRHQNMVTSEILGSLMLRHRVYFVFYQSNSLGESVRLNKMPKKFIDRKQANML